MAELLLTAVSPFAGLLQSSGKKHGTITDRSHTGLATVIVCKRRSGAFRTRVLDRLGIELTAGARHSGNEQLAFVGTSPSRFLAIGETSSLEEKLEGVAYVFDQTGAFGVLRIEGAQLLGTLSRSISLDLHPTAFGPCMAATTTLAHVGITLWRLPDREDGTVGFDVVVSRSMAATFWHHLNAFGVEDASSFNP